VCVCIAWRVCRASCFYSRVPDLVMEPELDLLRKISRSLALTFLYSVRKASSVCACAGDGFNFFCFIVVQEFLYTVFIFNAKFVEINLFVDVRAVRPVCA